MKVTATFVKDAIRMRRWKERRFAFRRWRLAGVVKLAEPGRLEFGFFDQRSTCNAV